MKTLFDRAAFEDVLCRVESLQPDSPRQWGKMSPAQMLEPDFLRTRERVNALLTELHVLGEKGCDGKIHVFFGRMTGAECGVTQFKHMDHHLRQFGA